MKHSMHVLLLVCILPILGGCATILLDRDYREKMVHDKTTPLCPLYSRSHLDLWTIYFPVRAFTPANDGKGDNAYATAFAITLGPFMIMGGALDLPISVAVDTLTLPWDMQRMRGKDNMGVDLQDTDLSKEIGTMKQIEDTQREE